MYLVLFHKLYVPVGRSNDGHDCLAPATLALAVLAKYQDGGW